VNDPKALAAAVTPLTDDDRIDEPAFEPYVRFLCDGGIDGVLALGTTGEGVMLSVEERESVAEAYLASRDAVAGAGFAVFVHCGAQTTRDTVALSRHAASAGAEGVAVIAPPYFAFDERSLIDHFVAAADACAPTAFYVYEFAARSGYTVPVTVIEELRERAPNLRGLKVSDSPFDAVKPYLLEGLDVFVGFEPLVIEGLANGAAGAVSGLAAAFPEVVASLVHDRDQRAHSLVEQLRRELGLVPFHAAVKTIIASRGVPVSPRVRAPLRSLTDDERRSVLAVANITA
jgi:4-hydroxy-tetrahydrodipicolinate synthase